MVGLAVDLHRTDRQAPGDARRADRACRSRSGWRRGGCSCRSRRSCCCSFVFLAEGAAGASVIDRYLLGAATVLLLFCAVCIGGWSMLRARLVAAPRLDRRRGRAGRLRRRLGRDDAEPHEPAHHARLPRGIPRGPRRGARRAAGEARSCAAARCSRCPNNKLIPDARWILDSVGQHDIVARSQARADVAKRRRTRSRSASQRAASRSTRSAARCSSRRSSTSATTRATRSRCRGFRRIYTSRYYAVYANC